MTFPLLALLLGLYAPLLLSAQEKYSDVPALVSGVTTAADPGIRAYAIGDHAEDFRLQNVDGRYISLSDYPDARGFIVVFTCNNCPCAGDYQKRLNWMQRKYAEQGYPVIAINANKADRKFGESLADMRQRSDSIGFSFPYLIDETQAVAKRFGAIRTPEVFVLVRDDETAWSYHLIYSGAIDDKPADESRVKRFYVGEAISLHERGFSPEVERVEPMGCTIEGAGVAGQNCPMQAMEDGVNKAYEKTDQDRAKP